MTTSSCSARLKSAVVGLVERRRRPRRTVRRAICGRPVFRGPSAIGPCRHMTVDFGNPGNSQSSSCGGGCVPAYRARPALGGHAGQTAADRRALAGGSLTSATKRPLDQAVHRKAGRRARLRARSRGFGGADREEGRLDTLACPVFRIAAESFHAEAAKMPSFGPQMLTIDRG